MFSPVLREEVAFGFDINIANFEIRSIGVALSNVGNPLTLISIGDV